MVKLILKELLLDIVIPVAFRVVRKLLDETEETARRKVAQAVPTTPEDYEEVQSNVRKAKDAVAAVEALRKGFKNAK